MPHDSLRKQLTAIVNKTASAANLGPGGWWVGDVAGERQVNDDWAVGRLEWRQAWNSAKHGLKALDDGNTAMAETCLTDAIWLYIAVLEKRVRAQDMLPLGRQSKKRGRPSGARSKKGRVSPFK